MGPVMGLPPNSHQAASPMMISSEMMMRLRRSAMALVPRALVGDRFPLAEAGDEPPHALHAVPDYQLPVADVLDERVAQQHQQVAVARGPARGQLLHQD